ncbi:hypothetical protein AB1Y20_004630 [Prymnesium parvum]|uniref:Uncharacterized protein n=1 Tax=Prymnesium parvum TaxID=97485 RepID=A0AB34IX90_PRYPA
MPLICLLFTAAAYRLPLQTAPAVHAWSSAHASLSSPAPPRRSSSARPFASSMLMRDQWDVPLRTNQRPSVDWSAREMKRMALMVRANEPLEEELHGLAGLGALAGMFVGRLLLGSVVLGMVLGAQLAPALGFVEGTRGDSIRATGWRAARMSASLAYEVCELYDSIETWAHRAGLVRCHRRLCRGAVQALSALDEWTGARAKAHALGRLLVLQCARFHAAWRASGLPSTCHQLWIRTGIPGRVTEWHQRAVLNARIAAVRARERRF